MDSRWKYGSKLEKRLAKHSFSAQEKNEQYPTQNS